MPGFSLTGMWSGLLSGRGVRTSLEAQGAFSHRGMTGAALFSLGLGALLRYLGVRWGTPLTLRHFWLPLSVLAVEVLGVLMGFPLQGLVYLGVFLWLALNWHPIFLPSLLGAGLNALAILLYGGMPVDPVALERAGLAHTVSHLASRGTACTTWGWLSRWGTG